MDTPESSYGRPIKAAVRKGYYAMVHLLVDSGANVNGVTGGTETTLRLAHRSGDEKMIKLLRELGAELQQCHWLPPKGQIVVI